MATRFSQFNNDELAILSKALLIQNNNSVLYTELMNELKARKTATTTSTPKLVSENCTNLIKSFEGLYTKAYSDPVGIPTVGYGTIEYPNGNKVKLGDVITDAEATEYLMYEVNQKAEGVRKMLGDIKLSQNQFDALVSFAYNVGLGALQDSTLLKLLKSNAISGASSQFLRWDKAGGTVLAGLTRRRVAEKELFDKVN